MKLSSSSPSSRPSASVIAIIGSAVLRSGERD
jgi:hypothetical protein